MNRAFTQKIYLIASPVSWLLYALVEFCTTKTDQSLLDIFIRAISLLDDGKYSSYLLPNTRLDTYPCHFGVFFALHPLAILNSSMRVNTQFEHAVLFLDHPS